MNQSFGGADDNCATPLGPAQSKAVIGELLPAEYARADAAGYQDPNLKTSIIQIFNSFGGFFAACAVMYAAFDHSLWLTMVAGVFASGFLVRIFIIQHDCGHGSFFRTRRANDILGMICSLFTVTPYLAWRRQHAGHHGSWNNLDRRSSDVDFYSTCLTSEEYRALSPRRRLGYRLLRHPIVANLILPPVIFLILYRIPFDTPKTWRKERRALNVLNISLVGAFIAMGFIAGFGRVLAIQLPVIALASIIGVWLFSVQHRFEETLWAKQSDWSLPNAALFGSSFLKLPAILQWFTGNIGFHHVHHLNPHIPNYRLQACHDENAAIRRAPVLTLFKALGQARFAVWDERSNRMISFAAADRHKSQSAEK